MVLGIIHIFDYLCTTRDNQHLKCNNMKTNKSYLLIAAVLTFLFTLSSSHSLAQDISTGDNKQGVESNTSTTSKSENQAKYSIPSIYKQKLDAFLKNDLPIIKIDSTSTWTFTADFVKKEMESDWGISKNNQMLFVWHCIYGQITGKDLYDGEDGNSERLEEFRVSIPKIRSCSQRYKEGILPFIKKQSEEYDRRIAEAQQRSAEAQQRSAEAITSSLDNLVWFYNRYKKDPSTILEEEIKQWKELCKKVVSRCKEENIDYKAKLSKDMLKFYEIE